MKTPGSPILVDGDGNVLPGDFDTVDKALAEARRLARKRDDDIYVYIATKRVQPAEPKVEEVELGK